MKPGLLLISLLFVGLGCQRTTTVDMSEQRGQLELSEESREAIEQIVRDVVREELSNLRTGGSASVSEALQEAKSKSEFALLEEKKKNADQMVMTCLRIASDVQAWNLKPVAFGGGGRSDNFNGLTLERIGYPVEDDDTYSTLDGRFELELKEEGKIVVVQGRNEAYQNFVSVKVAGTRAQDITTEVRNLQ